MTNDNKDESEAMESGNLCQIRLPVTLTKRAKCRSVENVRNCDIFVDDYHVLIYADVRQLKYNSHKQLDTKNVKNTLVRYDSQARCYELQLHCLEHGAEGDGAKITAHLDLWKLKRITDSCRLQLDDNRETVNFEANFDYGFASKYKGRIRGGESDLSLICRVPEPQRNSPLQRSIDREIDELRSFSREQYKLNFVELQVPDGHENPMIYRFNFNETQLSGDQECLLHNFTCKPDDMQMPAHYDPVEVDCGLISLLLPICYDIRSTSNEPTCESGWTRSILSALLTYFEPFDSMKEVVISFLRRSLVYPLYRNYDLGRLCVQDSIDALQRGRGWILKQLLLTHELFMSDESSREVFNRYYIVDYIRYVHSEALCSDAHLETLAHNLKNVLLDVYKKHLRLDLNAIETELFKELITEIHIGGGSSDSEGEEESEAEDVTDATEEDSSRNGDDDDDAETDNLSSGNSSNDSSSSSSSSSESEENSVIEQQLDALKIN